MTKKILCPTDGTPHSMLAVAVAAELALKYGAELSICVVNVAHGGGRGPLINHWNDEEVAKILADAAAEAKLAGIASVHTAEVVDRDPILDAGDAGLGIDLDLADVAAVGEGRLVGLEVAGAGRAEGAVGGAEGRAGVGRAAGAVVVAAGACAAAMPRARRCRRRHS